MPADGAVLRFLRRDCSGGSSLRHRADPVFHQDASYAHERGAFRVIDLRKTEKSITDFFDMKRGILYLHATWEGGGHCFIAVDYTRHEIDGKNPFLLHIVDSGAAGTVKQFTAYDFATFDPAVPDETRLPAGEYWMPLQNGVDITYGLWTKPETEQP